MTPFEAALALVLLLGAAPSPTALAPGQGALAAGPGIGTTLELEAPSGERTTVQLEDFELDPRQAGESRLESLRILVLGPVTQPAVAPGEDAGRLVVELLGGDRLTGAVAGGRAEQLLVEGPGGTPIPVSIDAIDSVMFPGRIPEDPGIRVERPAEGDRLYRRVGRELDRVDGTLDGFDLEGVRFESLVGSSLVPWGELAALFVEPLGGIDPLEISASGPPVVVDLVDGSRLSGALLRLDAGGLGLELTGETRVLFQVADVALISARDDRLAYLSELEPVRVEEGSAFGDEVGMVFRHQVDRAVFGRPLECGGRRFARGLGVLTPSRLEWALPAESPFDQLRGTVGIDQAAGALGLEGSVRFAVELDGEEAWTSPVLNVSAGPLALPPLDVSNARRLALVAHMERDWNTGDLGDWLDVRLVRHGASEVSGAPR